MAKIKKSKLNAMPYYEEYKASREEKEKEAEKSASPSKPSGGNTSGNKTKTPTIKKSKLNNIAGYNEYKAKNSNRTQNNKPSAQAQNSNRWGGSRGQNSNLNSGRTYASVKQEIADLTSKRNSVLKERGRLMNARSTDELGQLKTYGTQLNDIDQQLKALQAELKELDKNRPVYLNETATRMLDSVTSAENALKQTRGSGMDITAEVQKRGESLSAMERNVQALADAYQQNQTEDAYNRYLAAYQQYEKAAQDYNALYDEYKGMVDSYNAAYDDYSDYMANARSNASGWEIAGDTAKAGISSIARAFGSTLDFLLPAELWDEKDPLSKFINKQAADAQYFNDEWQESIYGRSGAVKTASEVGKFAVEAIPNAILAYMSGGTSMAAQGTAALQAANASTRLATTIGNATRTMMKRPTYWSSVAQTLGPTYEAAKENGANELQASATAIISSMLNAGVESSGGIEMLPARLRSGNTSAILQWVKSMPEEGIEEVIQRMVSGSTEKLIYDHDKPIYSTTDPEAIINPAEMGKEFLMGSAVAGVLGGAQIGTASAVNSLANRAYNRQIGQQAADPAETLEQLARETVAQRTPAADNAVEATNFAQAQPVSEVYAEADKVPTQNRNARRAAVNAQNKNMVDELGYGEHGRAAFEAIAESSDMTVDEVNAEFHLPYLRGLSNQELTETEFTSETQLAAFNAGKRDRIVNMNLDADNARFATAYGKESGLVPSEASRKYNAKTVAVLNKASKVFGTKSMLVDEIWQKDGVIVPKGTEGATEGDAAMREDGVLMVSLNAGDPLYTLMKHEFTHRFQQLAPAEYHEYREAVMQYVLSNDTGVVARYQNELGYTVDRSADEIAADFSAYIMKDVDAFSKFLDSMLDPEQNTAEQVAKNRNVLEWLMTAIRDFIGKVRKAFGGDKGKMDAAAQEVFGADVDTLQELEARWKRAAEASAKAVKTLESSKKQEYTDGTKAQMKMKEGPKDEQKRESRAGSLESEGTADRGRGSTVRNLVGEVDLGGVLHGLARRGRLNPSFGETPNREWAKDSVITPAKGSVAYDEQQIAMKYNIPSFVISDEAWEKSGQKKAPAFSHDGQIYFRETMPEKNRGMLAIHEITHIMKQSKYAPYMSFIDRVPSMLNLDSMFARSLLLQTANHRHIDVRDADGKLDLKKLEALDDDTRIKLYDEFNASLYGRIGSNKVGPYLEDLHDAFYDYDAYAAELTNLHSRYRRRRGGRAYFSMTGQQSLLENQQNTVDAVINQSMTMQQAKDMVQRAFVMAGIKDWYDGEYRNGDEWLKGEGADEVAMYIENEYQLQVKYLNNIQGLMDEDFMIQDILEAYLAGTLTGKQAQKTKPKRLDTSGEVNAQDDRFYAPHQIENAKAAYELASQKVTNKNREAVYKARADVIMFAHTRGAAEALGLTQSELNKKLSTWARYTARARETSQRFNAGVADWNKWTGIENSNILTRSTVSNEDLDQLVGEITGDSDGFQRKYIMRTMLALDTHIDYTGLKFEFVGVPDPNKRSVNGWYSDSVRKIRVKYNAPNTVAHEMGHYLDYQWARDVGLHGALTESRRGTQAVSGDVKVWHDHFMDFIDSLTDAADLHSSYTMDHKEVFARFVDKFVRWVNFTANGEQDREAYFDRNDKFTAQHYIEFVRLLQEKSVLDGQKKQSKAQFSQKGQSDLLKQSAETKAVNSGLQDLFKTGKVVKMDKKSMTDFAKSILKENKSGADINGIRDELNNLYNYLVSGTGGHKAEWDDAYQWAFDIATEILESAVELNDALWQEYKPLRDDLRTRGIKIDQSYSNDLMGYENLNAFRKANMGKIKMTNDGTPVDVVFHDLAERYPEFFNEEEYSTQGDQLVRMAEVLDSLKPTEYNPHSYTMRESATWLANDIMMRYYRLQNNKLADAIERGKKNAANERKRYMERREEAVKKVKEKYGERMAKGRDNRKAKELRDKITSHADQVRKKLLNGTDKSNVPEVLRSAVAEVMACINLESNYTYDPATGGYKKSDDGLPTRRTEEFRKIKEQYEAIAANNDIGMTIAPEMLGVPLEGIKSVLDQVIALKDTRLVDMNMSQLETVYNTIRMVEHSILTAGKTLSHMRWETIDSMAASFKGDTDSRKTKRSLTEKHKMLDIETPYTFFSHFGKAGHDFYRMLRDAQDQEQVMQDELKDSLSEIVSLEDRKKAEKEIVEYTTQRGDQLTLSKAHIMNLYLLSKRKQAQGHLFGGGIVQPKVGKVRKGTEAILLTQMDLANLFSYIQEEQEIADGLQKLTLKLAEWGNEASMTVYGIKKFNDPDYWTIHSSDIGFSQTIEQGPNRARSIANMGSAKSVIPEASNPLDIDSVFEVFDQHASDMLCYSAWLAPMEDANRLFNYKYRDASWNLTGKTVKGIIERVAGTGGKQYWMRLMEDIQNGLSAPADTATEQDVMKAIGNVRKASVSGNIRVVIQQPTAYARAAVVLGPDVMLAALGKDAAVKPMLDGWKKAVKYAPIAARKAAGGYEVSSNPKQLAELLYQPESKLGKTQQGVKEAPLWAAGAMDKATWGTIWNACEMQVRRNNKSVQKGTEAFYEAVADLFTEVIDQTQVVDGVLQRSQAMRSGSNFVKQMTSFTGEPTQAGNLVIRAYDQLRYETDPKKRGKAIRKLSRAVSVYTFTAVLNAFAQSLVDGLRDDDDDKEYWDKVWSAFSGINGNEETWKDFARNVVLGSNVANNMNPMTWLPVWKDVLSVIQGYSVERMDAANMSDFFDSMSMVLKTLGGDGKYTTGYAALKALVAGAKLKGSAASNILRDVESVVRTFQVETDDYMARYETMKMMTKPKNNMNAYAKLLFKAYQNDQEAYKKMYNDLLKSGVEADTIQSKMENLMKKAQGVTKVDDLEQRFLPPTKQAEYDRALKNLRRSDVWRDANAEQRDKAEDMAYKMVMDKLDEATQEMIDGGADYGVNETDYLLYQLALSVADQPNENGNLGTYTSAEKAEAILSMDASDSETAYLWDTKEGYEAFDAGVGMDHYVQFKAGVTSMEPGVDYEKGNTESRKRAIRALLREIGLSSDDYDYDWLWHTVYKE